MSVKSPSRLLGLHHLSAISSHAQDTIDVYAGTLGFPLLKKTVNYDDPGSYHLHFGDPVPQLGTMAFFVSPDAHRGQIGRGGTSHVSFSISSNAEVDRWESWLRRNGIATATESLGDGVAVLRLEDPDGLPLDLVSDARASGISPESAPADTQVLRRSAAPQLGPIQQVAGIVSDLKMGSSFYADVLGLEVESRTTGGETNSSNDRYTAAGTIHGGVPLVVLLQADESTPKFRLGAGLTHHFALQVATETNLAAWRDYLNDSGTQTTDIKDRRYFQSIYFHDPDGQVVEIATNGPGFAVDEPVMELGQHLSLPPWLESNRPDRV